MSQDLPKDEAILITGGTGFIGSHLAKHLVTEGYPVVLFEAKPNLARISEFADKITLVEGDVTNWSDVMCALTEHEIKHIFHMAARLSVESERNPGTAYACNVTGTYNVLEAARIMQVKRFVFLSSLAVFGANTPFPFQETSYRDPGSFYGVSKAFGEMLGSYYHLRHNFDFRGVRFAVAIGPGRRGAGATVTYSSFIEHLALGRPGLIDVPDTTILPVIYIADVVSFLIALWKASKLTQRIFIAGGVPISIQDLIEEAKTHIPKAKVKFELDPDAARVAQTWSFLTMLLVQQKQETLYREIEQLGWKLRYNSVTEIVKHFIDYVQSRREIFSRF